MNANEAGYQFYRSLYESFLKKQMFRFSLGPIDVRQFNEQIVKNKFAPGLIVDDTEGVVPDRREPDFFKIQRREF
jgi:hypothetical protein